MNAIILDKILLLKQLHKVIKKKLRIRRPAGSFGVELCGEPRISLMPDALIGAIVHIDEQRFPVFRQRVVVYGVTMILGGDETTLSTHHAHRLVMAAVSIFQFVYLGAPRLGKQLVPHTYAEDRQFLVLHRLADIPYGSIAGIRVAGTVGDEQTVELQPVIIVVPGNTDHFDTTPQQTTDDVVLDTAIHKHYAFPLRTGS